MAVVTTEQEKKMTVSANLDDVDETTEGVYYTQNIWRIDENTGMAVGVQMNVTFT